MSNEDHWVTTRITEAKHLHPLVTEAVMARIDQLLKGHLSERPLTPTELKSVATGLIGDTVPDAPKPEAIQ